MLKNKRPASVKPKESSEEKYDALIQSLCDLAIELVEQGDSGTMSDALKQKESDFRKIIKKSLLQKKDEVLYEALERTKYADDHAYRFLKSSIEEASEVLIVRRNEGGALEINAFVIPMFVHTTGGLNIARSFQDQEAFDLLTESFKKGGLESPEARVVLISHAYHLEEIDRITYSDLADMLRDAFASMTEKKAQATPAIDRSLSGWPENNFDPDDEAFELRFLLGFTLKAIDDVLYVVPEDEAAADAYFAAREESFQRWTERVKPLVARCMGMEIDVNFLYQDLFHGGKERGIAEHFMLQMMSELNRSLAEQGIAADRANAIVGPIDIDGEMILRVNLCTRTDGTLFAFYEKPLAVDRDWQADVDDVCDALMTLGIESVSLAAGFGIDGAAFDARPYNN